MVAGVGRRKVGLRTRRSGESRRRSCQGEVGLCGNGHVHRMYISSLHRQRQHLIARCRHGVRICRTINDQCAASDEDRHRRSRLHRHHCASRETHEAEVTTCSQREEALIVEVTRCAPTQYYAFASSQSVSAETRIFTNKAVVYAADARSVRLTGICLMGRPVTAGLRQVSVLHGCGIRLEVVRRDRLRLQSRSCESARRCQEQCERLPFVKNSHNLN